MLEKTKSNVIITHLDFENEVKNFIKEKFFVLIDGPKLCFIKVASALFYQKYSIGIDKSSVISSEAKIGKNVYIGPHCFIGKVEIGDNSSIMGNNCILDKTIIGKNVIINPGTIIGSDGFGYLRYEEKA